ncbi:MAG: DUF4825 domain-containing protein [Lachnospiraceae bacterium]|nr:DUF4825 domain-containing protein [Lachnospiraceae bacterium]
MKEIIITSSVLILCIMLIRVIFKGKISSRLQYALWLLVAIRLIIPASAQIYMAIGSIEGFRIMDLAEIFESKVGDVTEQLDQPVASGPFAMSLNSSPAEQAVAFLLRAPYFEDGPTSVFIAGKFVVTWLDVLRGIWIGGMLIVALWMIIINVLFSRRLHKGRQEFDSPEAPGTGKMKIYTIEGLVSPCLYGLPFREAVYLTPDIAEDQDKLHHVLTHEMCHKKHGDSFWSILRSILLIIYWMNPFVWMAAVLSKRDCELACDEEALLILGEEERISYGETLLSIITRKGRLSDIACTATTMTGSGKSVKERIKFIADKPRVLGVAVVAVLVLVMVVSVLVFTKNPLFHGTTWEGEATVTAGDIQVRLPETISGISGYQTDRNDDIVIYQVASGEEVGRFKVVLFSEAMKLLEEHREIVPLGNYGSNQFLKEYMNAFYGYHFINTSEIVTHTYTPNAFMEEPKTTYPDEGKNWMSDSDWEVVPLEDEEPSYGVLAHEDMYEPDNASGIGGVPGMDSNDDSTTYVIEDDGFDSSSFTEREVEMDYLPDEQIETVDYPNDPLRTVEYLPNEELVSEPMLCYIYVKGDYSRVKDQYLTEMDYINNELQEVTDQVVVISINQELQKAMFKELAQNRTEYLGDTTKVVALIRALPQPDGLLHTETTTHTLASDPETETGVSLMVNYRLMADSLEDVDSDILFFDAVMLFASVKNLETCNFVVRYYTENADGTVDSYYRIGDEIPGDEIAAYNRTDLEETFGPLWSDEAAGSQEDYAAWLGDLYDRIAEYAETNQ